MRSPSGGRRMRLAIIASLSMAALFTAAGPAVASAPGGPSHDRPHDNRNGDKNDNGNGGKHDLQITVLSSRPDQVSGGDALVQVQVPDDVSPQRVRIRLNGAEVTRDFSAGEQRRTLVGLVDGMRAGANVLTAETTGDHRRDARLTLNNHSVTGPIFSGPQQQPFVCKTEQSGLGQPLVDNHDHVGLPVFALDADGQKTDQVVGWSRDCSVKPRVDFVYRTTSGGWKPLPADGGRPADLATTTTADGRVVDFVVRWERGTIDRFIYSIAMLSPLKVDANHAADSAWNRRLIYSFSSGGVGIGHNQGELGTTIDDMFEAEEGLAAGYAVAYSTGNDTGNHYNLQVGGEAALMVKERFIEEHGEPLYTVGVGASGGGLQQYVYGQNHPGLIDAAIPVYAYPDMVTQGIHVGDCELLEYFMDVTDAGNPKWQNWDNRKLLEGMNSSSTVRNPYTGKPGSSECVNGWRGLSPLTLNPHYGSAGSNQGLMEPKGVMDTVKWTHFDDLRNIYGVKPDGFARRTFDNVGVQYGLEALRDGTLTPDEFLHLNATVGGWKDPEDMVQEGAPFVPGGTFDPWSSRNMTLSPDGGATPAPRTEGDVGAIEAAYRSGMVFRGKIDIPIIDWRHYLEDELNMHNSRQSFASRERIIEAQGNADNQAIWFTDARPGGAQSTQLPEAFKAIDTWMANIRKHPERTVGQNKPSEATDRCFATDGRLIASGSHVWDGILDHRADGACTEQFPIHSTSRIVAGGPFDEDLYKCGLQPVDKAVARGVYGQWRPDASERARLKQIFPSGVCDYTKPPVGRP
ncbi:DUF6351 family protein [Planotetraspora kaengkrachanensis]|uniref:DUF6351 domain-containing protein n=1 Tax=Planotetraspora kaengkrachanensis TaxID=575193 RepID=A0A8J3V914_9ACTN|nr:DUF6351 family protein [Planotetraspora kaengkrachanensis]GIG82258.1 hypothetical protein Pka01_53850 [Planotetraspora kaengkrachanensis]